MADLLLKVDIDKRKIITDFTGVLNQLELKRGDIMTLRVQFYSGSTVQELASGSLIYFGVKDRFDYSGDYLALASSFTKTGTGTSTYYEGTLNLNTTDIQTLLGASTRYAWVVSELQWIASDQPVRTIETPTKLWNAVNRSGDATPTGNTTSTYGQSAITNGAPSVAVTFTSHLASVPTVITVTVMAPSGGSQITATVDNGSITASGFTAELNMPAPATGYILAYAAYV